MSKRHKAKSWEEIDEKVKDQIAHLRNLEIEYKDKSGYNKWLTYFSVGSLIYSFGFYNFYLKKQIIINSGITTKNLFLLFTPIVFYGLTLMKVLYDKKAFKEYYTVHIELNRLIKKSISIK